MFSSPPLFSLCSRPSRFSPALGVLSLILVCLCLVLVCLCLILVCLALLDLCLTCRLCFFSGFGRFSKSQTIAFGGVTLCRYALALRNVPWPSVNMRSMHTYAYPMSEMCFGDSVFPVNRCRCDRLLLCCDLCVPICQDTETWSHRCIVRSLPALMVAWCLCCFFPYRRERRRRRRPVLRLRRGR